MRSRGLAQDVLHVWYASIRLFMLHDMDDDEGIAIWEMLSPSRCERSEASEHSQLINV